MNNIYNMYKVSIFYVVVSYCCEFLYVRFVSENVVWSD